MANAAKTYEQVIDINNAMEIGDPIYAMSRLADLELAQGRVQHAHRLVIQALDAARSRNADVSDPTHELGFILEAEGDLQGARQQYQAALDIKQKKGRMIEVAEVQESLSELALQEGHPDLAETSLRAVIAEFEKEKADPDATRGYTQLSHTLLFLGWVQTVFSWGCKLTA